MSARRAPRRPVDAPARRRSRPAPAPGLARLWSPWRSAYVARAAAPAGCLFCRVARGRDDRGSFVLARRGTALLMLNRFPYNPAHLMVAPARHAAAFGDLGEGERADLLDLTALAERTLAAEYRPHGINVGANLGRVAGAGFPGHLHLHLVPRWEGDTNFMPVVGATRVLPESLDVTWRRLRKRLATLLAPRAGSGGRKRSASSRPAAGPRPAPRRRSGRR